MVWRILKDVELKFKFELVKNGKVLISDGNFPTYDSCKNHIESIKEVAPEAEILDGCYVCEDKKSD